MVCQSLSHIRLFVTPWIVAHLASLSIEFPRQECWLPFPSPRDLPHPEIEAKSVASPTLAGRFLASALPVNNIIS